MGPSGLLWTLWASSGPFGSLWYSILFYLNILLRLVVVVVLVILLLLLLLLLGDGGDLLGDGFDLLDDKQDKTRQTQQECQKLTAPDCEEREKGCGAMFPYHGFCDRAQRREELDILVVGYTACTVLHFHQQANKQDAQPPWLTALSTRLKYHLDSLSWLQMTDGSFSPLPVFLHFDCIHSHAFELFMLFCWFAFNEEITIRRGRVKTMTMTGQPKTQSQHSLAS